MKKTVIFVIAAAALLFIWLLYRGSETFFQSSSGTKEASNWVAYNSPTDLFSVSFPVKPEYTSEIERDADGFAKRAQEIYASEDANHDLFTIYFVRYLSNEGELPLPANTLLNNLMNEILDKQNGNVLLDSKKRKFHERDALEFTISNSNLTMQNLAFVNKGDLYLITLTTPGSQTKPKEFETFIQSFKFNP